MTTSAEVNEVNGQLAELVKRVQAGNEVLLTQDHKPVAKLVSVPAIVHISEIVSASEKEIAPGTTLQIRSLKGHLVLTPNISQSELADEMFSRS